MTGLNGAAAAAAFVELKLVVAAVAAGVVLELLCLIVGLFAIVGLGCDLVLAAGFAVRTEVGEGRA